MSIEFLHRDGTPADTSASCYPGGEARVEIDVSRWPDQVALVRGALPGDLIVLAVWANSVRRMGGNPIAFVPYLPAARADHAERADGFDAAAYARILNAAELDELVCVDPHSSVMPALLDRCSIIEAVDLVDQHLDPFIRESLAGIIIPDDGAAKRAVEVARRLGLNAYQAHKHRDPATGELSGFSCEPLPREGDLLVVDDICDGGGTFRGLAEASGVRRDRLHLWVSHGIFSGAAYELAEDYSTIFTTDSHYGFHNIADVRVVHLLPHLLGQLDQGGA